MNQDSMIIGAFLFMAFFAGGITGLQIGLLVALQIMTNNRK